jgi:hypothetical protein
MREVLAARDGILLVIDRGLADARAGRGATQSPTIQIINLGPGHAFVATSIIHSGAGRPIALASTDAFVAPGEALPLFDHGALGSGAPTRPDGVGRPQPNPIALGRPLLVDAEIYVGDKQLRVQCTINVSRLTDHEVEFQVLSSALAPTR